MEDLTMPCPGDKVFLHKEGDNEGVFFSVISLHSQELMNLKTYSDFCETVLKEPVNKFMADKGFPVLVKARTHQNFCGGGVLSEDIFHKVIVLSVGDYELHFVLHLKVHKIIKDILMRNATGRTFDVHYILETAVVGVCFNRNAPTCLNGDFHSQADKLKNDGVKGIPLKHGLTTSDAHIVDVILHNPGNEIGNGNFSPM